MPITFAEFGMPAVPVNESKFIYSAAFVVLSLVCCEIHEHAEIARRKARSKPLCISVKSDLVLILGMDVYAGLRWLSFQNTR